MNFSSYLTFVNAELTRLDRYRLIRIVLGNESADLDSAVASSVYAYFLHRICSETNEILHVPVLNTNIENFRLRTEIRWFLGENFSKMIFIKDLPVEQMFVEEKLEIILVDHHEIASPLNEVVVEIIDHHQVKNDSTRLCKSSSSIRIEPVGSCCTLIGEKILEEKRMTNEIASLLIGPIVFDTVNFSSTAGKTTEKDRRIFAELFSFCSTSIDSNQLFDDLKRHASEIEGLTSEDLLRKDAKQVKCRTFRFVMSSLPMNFSVEKFFDKIESLDELNEFLMKNDNADGLIVTSIETKNEKTQRQLAFYVPNEENFLRLNEILHHTDLNLNLNELDVRFDRRQMKIFDQENFRASRKQILPFLERHF